MNELTSPLDINTVFKKSGLSIDEAKGVLDGSNWASKLNDIAEPAAASAEAATNMGIALAGLKNSKTALATIGTTLKTTLMNPLTWMAGVGIAAVGALIYKATEFDRAVNASAKSQSVFASAANELSELNSQMDAVSARISELQALKQQQKISPAESTELNLLMLQNSKLERQIQLKEKPASQLSDIAVNDTLRALNQKNTIDLVPTENSENGSDTKKVYDDFGTAYYAYDKTDIITATEKEIEKLEDLKETKANLMAEIKNPLTGSERKAAAEKELQDTESEITKLTHNVTDQIQDLQVLYEGLSDPVTGLMKEGMSAEAQIAYQSMTDIFSNFNTLDLTGAEAELAKLDNFFNGSSGRNYIKDALMAASDAGENLEDALRGMGLSLENLGIDNVDTLKQYLEGIRTVFDSLSDGTSKERLGGLLEQWDSDYAYFLEHPEELGNDTNRENIHSQFSTMKILFHTMGVNIHFKHRVFHLLNKPLRVLRFFPLGEAIATINSSSAFK